MEAIYQGLTTDDIITWCLKGMTQNRTEHLHSHVRKMCPKLKPASTWIVEFATANAVSDYNVGYVAICLVELLGIQLTT